MNDQVLEPRKALTSAWFEKLRDDICAALEAVESELPADAPLGDRPPGRFTRKAWQRVDRTRTPGGGGVTAMLRGRVFEKAGAHVSVVHGQMVPEAAEALYGPDAETNFWAAGVSVIAHPHSPHVPTVHMNTRYVISGAGWFGGGSDLTPMLDRHRTQQDPDTVTFHAAMKKACDAHAAIAPYEKFKQRCDEYFFLRHRNEPRGVGGIFFDRLDSGNWAADMAFTQDVGRAFLDVYPRLVRRNFTKPWNDTEREEQLARRGRYVEFNLLFDRGTVFGLRTGGNVDGILSSLPPTVKWP
jgi:coproporphyrinogen III oxidase